MTQAEYSNVYATASFKAFKALIDACLEYRNQKPVSELLSDNDTFGLLIAASQCTSEAELGKEAKRINRIAFPSYDKKHAPGSSYWFAFTMMLKFGQHYKDCFVRVDKPAEEEKSECAIQQEKTECSTSEKP